MTLAQRVCSMQGNMGDRYSPCATQAQANAATAAYKELFPDQREKTTISCDRNSDCGDKLGSGYKCDYTNKKNKTCYKPPPSCDDDSNPCADGMTCDFNSAQCVPDYDSCTHQVECMLAGGEGAACE